MFTRELQDSIDLSQRVAKDYNHEYVMVDHLLLVLMKNQEVAGFLSDNLVDTAFVFGGLLQVVVTTNTSGNYGDYSPSMHADYNRVLEQTGVRVTLTGQREVTGIDVLITIVNIMDTPGTDFLIESGLDADFIGQKFMQKKWRDQLQKYKAPELAKPEAMEEPVQTTSPIDEDAAAALKKYCTNLNHEAQKGCIDPLIGRGIELQRIIQTLCRRNKNNPLMVGDAGVGKTAIIEGLASRIVLGKVPDKLLGYTIFSFDHSATLAGTKYRGDFEKRIKLVIAGLKQYPKSILFIDEIHAIVGNASNAGESAGSILKPELTKGYLRCIGSTTYDEYRQYFEKDSALSRRFQKVDIVEPTIEEAYQILQGLKPKFEEFHQVKYSLKALHSAVRLSDQYLRGRKLPDKAIDVIDEAAAFENLKPIERRKKKITSREIEVIVAKIARIPHRNISSSDTSTLKNLTTNLQKLVFGQDKAIESLASAIKLTRAGLGEEAKPIGSFLLSGPTGVGKTEVTVQLAKLLGIELIRFDMSEYMESHTISKLIGSPPGYVGHERAGLLTEALIKHPHAILLLDEIEKAHPDIFNILLQVMDYGTLADNLGRVADFRHAIIIMTTNAGAADAERSTMGFTPSQSKIDDNAAIKTMFSPEFRNRLDAVVNFSALSIETIGFVADKFITQLKLQLAKRRVILNIEDRVRHYLIDHGYDSKMGARPMGRLIKEKIRKPLSEELLFGKLVDGGAVTVDIEDEEVKLTF